MQILNEVYSCGRSKAFDVVLQKLNWSGQKYILEHVDLWHG